MHILDEKGASLLEAVVAIGLAAIFLSGTVGLVIISKEGSTKAQDRQEALWYAHQGMDAVRAMDFDTISATETGNLTFASETWTLAGTGSQEVGDKYTRTIHVAEAYRDEDCQLVESGGELDEDSFYLSSEIAWQDVRGNSQTIEIDAFITRWDDMQSICSEMADAITFDFSMSAWFGGKQLREIYLTNNSDGDIVISGFIIYWDNEYLIQQVFLDTSKIWSSVGPGSPAGEQPSGTELDVVDQTIVAMQDTVEIPKIQFTEIMDGSSMIFTIIFEDGSSVTSPEFTPLVP